jgi:osmotically-inducible protein OsmY
VLLLSTALLAALVFAANWARAQKVAAPANTRLDEIVVTAKRRSDPVADEKMKVQVEEALHSDPFFNDSHVTVTTRNGVVKLEGIVFDDWDLRQAMRLSKKVAGVKRVVEDLEIKFGGD